MTRMVSPIGPRAAGSTVGFNGLEFKIGEDGGVTVPEGAVAELEHHGFKVDGSTVGEITERGGRDAVDLMPRESVVALLKASNTKFAKTASDAQLREKLRGVMAGNVDPDDGAEGTEGSGEGSAGGGGTDGSGDAGGDGAPGRGTKK